MLVEIDEPLRRHGFRIGYLTVEGVEVRPSSLELEAEISRIIDSFRRRYDSLDMLREDPVIQAYRRSMWRLGIDPTKVRPSSEALARRVLRGKPFPRINNVVDAGNASSLLHLVPIGLYDLDRVKTPLTLTRCSGECTFEPIGGESRKLMPGTPVLLDSLGVVVHVYPHRDSRRTAINPGTKRVLALSAGVPGVPEEELARALEDFVRLLQIDGLRIRYTSIELVE